MTEEESRQRSERTIAELERKNQILQNEIELARSEAAHKTSILAQTSAELSELQGQYKQLLQKLSTMGQKTVPMTSDEERLYREQLFEQSACIATLENRVWKSDHLSRMYKVHGYKYDKSRCTCNKVTDMRSEISRLRKENQDWEDFAVRVGSHVSVSDSDCRKPDILMRAIVQKIENEAQPQQSCYCDKPQHSHDRAQQYIHEVQNRLDRMTGTKNRYDARRTRTKRTARYTSYGSDSYDDDSCSIESIAQLNRSW